MRCCVVFSCKLLISIMVLVNVYCSLVTPNHEFPEKRLHSYRPGSAATDSTAMFLILDETGLSPSHYETIAATGPDHRVYALDLSSMGLTSLPEAVCDLEALTNLDISNNLLMSLPDSITRLDIFYAETVCPVYQGGSSECYSIFHNGLRLSHNRLCSLPPEQEQWIDRQFGATGYLQSDTTQQCSDLP